MLRVKGALVAGGSTFSSPRWEDTMNFFFFGRHCKDPKCSATKLEETVVVTR